MRMILLLCILLVGCDYGNYTVDGTHNFKRTTWTDLRSVLAPDHTFDKSADMPLYDESWYWRAKLLNERNLEFNKMKREGEIKR